MTHWRRIAELTTRCGLKNRLEQRKIAEVITVWLTNGTEIRHWYTNQYIILSWPTYFFAYFAKKIRHFFIQGCFCTYPWWVKYVLPISTTTTRVPGIVDCAHWQYRTDHLPHAMWSRLWVLTSPIGRRLSVQPSPDDKRCWYQQYRLPWSRSPQCRAIAYLRDRSCFWKGEKW